ncbi:MAG: T9SS type A sorting domain-containing protein [bacterium]
MNLYGVASVGVPHIVIDGVLSPDPWTANQMRNSVNQRRAIASPCTMEVFTFTVGTTIRATVRMTAEEDMHATANRLFVALIHNSQRIGSTTYKYPFRDMEPSTSGEPFELDADSTFELTVEFTAESDWELDNMCVVAFAQNISTHEVLQAAYSDVSIAYSMELTASSAHTRLVPPSSTALFIALLTNLGTETDTYTATLGTDLPAGWTRTIEVQGSPPDPSSVTFSLESYASATLIVTVDPQGNPGVADITIHAASHAIPEITGDVDFVLLSGLDVLVVDDDEGAGYEDYYLAALQPFEEQLLSAAWDVSFNAPSASDLNQVHSIVWLTGNATTNTLSETEQTNLASFLDNGGALFLSGQGIGFDIGHPDPGTSFFTDYLHADFIGPYATGRTVYGVIGDPVSDGMSFDIYGGTGANNQTRQSDLDPLDAAATSFLTYTSDSFERNAALRIETPAYRAIYLGFGFEAIADEYNRNLLMANALDWLGVLAADKPDEALQPFSFSLRAGYPNPFNPVVSIPYSLGERSRIRLGIFDILGREVAVLVSGMQNPGMYTARWNASALPSGIYFSRLTAGSSAESAFDATQKLILLK